MHKAVEQRGAGDAGPLERALAAAPSALELQAAFGEAYLAAMRAALVPPGLEGSPLGRIVGTALAALRLGDGAVAKVRCACRPRGEGGWLLL